MAFFIIGLIVQIPAILVDHSRYLFQSFAGADISQAYGQTIISMEHSPVLRQWPVAIDLLQAYSRVETWQQAALNLQAIAEYAPDVPNGQAVLQSEFLRRNTPDFWWLHIRLFTPAHPVSFVAPTVTLEPVLTPLSTPTPVPTLGPESTRIREVDSMVMVYTPAEPPMMGPLPTDADLP